MFGSRDVKLGVIWAVANRSRFCRSSHVHRRFGPVHGRPWAAKTSSAQAEAGRTGKKPCEIPVTSMLYCALTAGLVGIFEAIRSPDGGPSRTRPARTKSVFFAVRPAVIRRGGTPWAGRAARGPFRKAR